MTGADEDKAIDALQKKAMEAIGEVHEAWFRLQGRLARLSRDDEGSYWSIMAACEIGFACLKQMRHAVEYRPKIRRDPPPETGPSTEDEVLGIGLRHLAQTVERLEDRIVSLELDPGRTADAHGG